jgi:sodium/potassium/calcium exchanger 6
VLWIAFLFIALGSTAEDYFCPALNVIADTLKLSHNVAGVTFLALGNGAPDIFSVYSSIMNTKGLGKGTALALGELFGAGCFVTTVVVGTISVLVPFRVTRRPFVRDLVVYLVAVLWVRVVWGFILLFLLQLNHVCWQTYVVLWDGNIHIYESLGYIVIYVLYVCVVIFGRKIYQSSKKAPSVDPLEARHETARTEELVPPHSKEALRVPTPPPVIFIATVEEDESAMGDGSSNNNYNNAPRTTDLDSVSLRSVSLTPRCRRAFKNGAHDFSPAITSAVLAGAPAAVVAHGGVDFHAVVNHGHHHHHHQDSSKPLSVNAVPVESFNDSESTPLLASRLDALPAETPMQKFLAALVPLNVDEFWEAKWYGKIYAIMAVPITVCLTLTIPVVDYEEEDQNWNKYLQALQCFTAPVFFVFGANIWSMALGGVLPAWAFAMIVGAGLSLFVFVATSGDKPPRFQMLFSFLGFFVAVVWIYIIANEIVNLLQALGRILTISDAILGLSVLAWGNSVGDFVSNVTVAKQVRGCRFVEKNVTDVSLCVRRGFREWALGRVLAARP